MAQLIALMEVLPVPESDLEILATIFCFKNSNDKEIGESVQSDTLDKSRYVLMIT